MSFFCHPSSEVQSSKIGNGTHIWQFVIVLKNALIGKNCNLNAYVFVENDVVIGDNVTIKSGVQLWDGTIIEDDVFIGPNASFTNDLVPRSKQYPEQFLKTIIRRGASIGANATIIAGNEIQEYALIGAGSVITKPVGKNEVWIGNPGKKVGYITNKGTLLDLNLVSKDSKEQYVWHNEILTKKDDDYIS